MEYYQQILTNELFKQIADETIFFQRTLKPTDELIGKCSLEEDEKRCPRDNWYARRFRILGDINNLRIIDPDGSDKLLDKEQHALIFGLLCGQKEVSFDTIRKKLGLLKSQTFNIEEGSIDKKKAKLKGDEFAAQMRGVKILGKKGWERLDDSARMEINEAIIDDDLSDEEVIKMLTEQHGFTQEQAEKAINISLPQRYMSYCELAIQKLLPYMEKGLMVHDAVKKVYGEYPQGQCKGDNLDILPLPEDLRNPIVNKALFEVRKVVNSLVREYGKPAKIKVEMARDMNRSRDQRDE